MLESKQRQIAEAEQLPIPTVRAILDGKPSAYRDVALLNAAAALIVAGKAKSLSDGVAIGAQSLDSGAAAARLKHLIAVSNS